MNKDSNNFMKLSNGESPPEPKAPVEGIVTSCRDCIFAVYDGDTQTGCEWDRLDKFEENGTSIVGQDDGQRKYFMVVGRFCNACRHRVWGEERPSADWKAVVSKEFAVKCSFIIYADENSTQQDVEDSLNSALNQEAYLPSEVVLLLKDHTVSVPVYLEILKETPFPWQVRTVVEGEAHDIWQSLDIAVKNIKSSTYYSIIKAEQEWPSTFLKVFNRTVNHKMKRVTAILPSGNCEALTLMVSLHDKLLGGSKDKWVVDKLLEVAKCEGTEHTIVLWGDLCE